MIYSLIISNVCRIYINSYCCIDRAIMKNWTCSWWLKNFKRIRAIAACCFELRSEFISFWCPLRPTPSLPVWPSTSDILVSSKETPLALSHSSEDTHKHAYEHPQLHACMWRAHISPATVYGSSPLSCSASYNIFSGCCVCTHRNNVITACQGFLCWETFAYSNALRREACRGWFSCVHIHIVGFCSCSAQLMDPSGQLFSSFSPTFTIKYNGESLPKFMLCTCVFMVFVCACLNSLIPMHKYISDLQPVYSLPRDTISLQIKDNGGQVNTGCTETIPTLQLYHIHTHRCRDFL